LTDINATWRKSSYSSGQGGQCVEVGTVPGLVGIRDTTQQGRGPVLRVSAGAWKTLIGGIR
jgi:hypothetical protein